MGDYHLLVPRVLDCEHANVDYGRPWSPRPRPSLLRRPPLAEFEVSSPGNAGTPRAIGAATTGKGCFYWSFAWADRAESRLVHGQPRQPCRGSSPRLRRQSPGPDVGYIAALRPGTLGNSAEQRSAEQRSLQLPACEQRRAENSQRAQSPEARHSLERSAALKTDRSTFHSEPDSTCSTECQAADAMTAKSLVDMLREGSCDLKSTRTTRDQVNHLVKADGMLSEILSPLAGSPKKAP